MRDFKSVIEMDRREREAFLEETEYVGRLSYWAFLGVILSGLILLFFLMEIVDGKVS